MRLKKYQARYIKKFNIRKDNQLKLYFTNHFPYKKKTISKNIYKVTLGIGGNITNTKQRFKSLFLALKYDSRFNIIQTSPLLKNPPFGYLDQDDFLNGIIVLNTSLSPYKLLNEMQRYEKRFGRKRSFKDAPRTLDIDIIFIEKNNKHIFINSNRLKVPHLYWQDRLSVTIPLKYMRL